MRKVTSILCCALLVTVITFFYQPEVLAGATYSTGFSTTNLAVTTPHNSGFDCDGKLEIEGTSSLDEVWFCTRGPGKELATYRADVVGGHFNTEVDLRFGPGQYTIWAGDNSRHFDGKIRFIVFNRIKEDTRYIAPSTFVDFDNDSIQQLLCSLDLEGLDDMEKVTRIHDWIAANIAYDYNSYQSKVNELVCASETLKKRSGMCRDYAFLFAALTRASNLPCKVVYGQASFDNKRPSELHAWNEVLVGDKWVSVDVTWDAGYINNSSFISSPTHKYLAVNPELFALSHQQTMIAVH